MSFKSQFGTNVNAMKKRVRWYNRESSAETIYEGQPVCYLFDTTTNILGYDKGAGGHPECQSSPTTTAEGYQNEGKFLIVEKPETDNLLWFAGVVAEGSWCGKSIAATSYEWIEIYIPNGAIVPVRTDLSTTVGVTILCVESDSQELTDPINTYKARPVAVAEETVDRQTTSGLVLAKLEPNMFLYQTHTSTALSVANDATVTGDMVVNRINVTSANTGRFTALEVIGNLTAAGNATGYGLGIYGEAGLSAAASGETAGHSLWMNLTGGTQVNELYALEIGLYESGANLTGCNRISPLCVRSQLDSTNAPNASHFMMTFICDGTGDHPDGWFACNETADIACTSASSVTTSAKIAFKVGSPGSYTTYYIPCGTSAS